MLVDEITIKIAAGHGGAGKYAPIKAFKSVYHPGDGGRGGDVYVITTSDLSALNRYVGVTQIKADDGEPGGANRATGKSGKDIEIVVPIGTSINGRDFDELGKRTLLCKGGLGGRGGSLERKAGQPGESISAHMVLRLIAKYGLIGLPNAGKSTLLNGLTNANAQVGAYPFTTLEPNLGVYNGQIIADIPGLIEGASEGKGLGIRFLKHIEKVSLLLHCIASDSKDVLADYETVNNELRKFGHGLIDKPQIIILTKTDLVSQEELLRQLANFQGQRIVTASKLELDAVRFVIGNV